MKIRKYFEMKILLTSRTVLKEKFIVSNTYIGKGKERCQINDLIFHLRNLKKKQRKLNTKQVERKKQ